MARGYTVGLDKESMVAPTLYLGVDPDTKGAIAVYCGKTESIMCIIPFTGKTYADLRFAIRALGPENVVFALVEKQFTKPVDRSDGVATMFTHYGRIVEMLESHNIPIVQERPQEWQKSLEIRSMIQGVNRKKELFKIAEKRYPEALKLIKATASTGSGDACLIAEYGYKNKERFEC